MTPLDTAHAAMADAPDDAATRLAFYERLADAELYLLLQREPAGDRLDPRLFETSEGRFVLAFDRAERLAEFAAGQAPYAVLSGRTLAGMLAGQRVGLALNPDVAPSAFLVDPAALAWLKDTLGGMPDALEARAVEVAPPGDLPERLVTQIDAKLATATGLARFAYLAAVTYDTGARGHMLAFIDAAPGAEGALARAVRETLVFSGLEAGALDVAFFPAASPVAARLARVGLRFDLPAFAPAVAPKAPGMDPDAPPKLR